MACKVASVTARRTLGVAAGVGMAIGIGGAMGSVLMFATALPPWSESESTVLRGFNDATTGLYANDTEQQQQARIAAAAVTGAAVVGSMKTAVKRA